jgi:hypothetical protein
MPKFSILADQLEVKDTVKQVLGFEFGSDSLLNDLESLKSGEDLIFVVDSFWINKKNEGTILNLTSRGARGIVLMRFESVDESLRHVALGIRSFLYLEQVSIMLLRRVSEVMIGRPAITPMMARKMLTSLASVLELDGNQIDVLKQISLGASLDEILCRFGVSELWISECICDLCDALQVTLNFSQDRKLLGPRD